MRNENDYVLSSTCYTIIFAVATDHRHLSNIDCLMARIACLVCFISTVNGCSKKRKEKEPIKTGASSGHITYPKQSILETFNIYANDTAMVVRVNEQLS
jgi:hypothetical protein